MWASSIVTSWPSGMFLTTISGIADVVKVLERMISVPYARTVHIAAYRIMVGPRRWGRG